MSNNRIDRWQTTVDDIVADYRRLNSACDAALKAGAMDANGPLYDAIWKCFHTMLDRIDVDGWISWFIYDNECGKKQHKAKGYGKRGATSIKTSCHIARLIVESKDYSQKNETTGNKQ